MKKSYFLLPVALLIFISFSLKASEINLALAEIQSSSDNQVTGSLQVRMRIEIFQDLILEGQPLITLPAGWSAVPEQISLKKVCKKGQPFEVRVLIKYPKNNLPFYPQSISISLPVSAKNDPQNTDLLSSEGKVYFTPYSTVELFSEGDFENANRVWINPNSGISAIRLKIAKNDIPVSNINMAVDTIGGKSMEDQPYELIYVPGLAYFIPMKLTSDSMLVGDFDDGEDSLGLDELDKIDALTQLLVAASNGDPIDTNMFLNKSMNVNGISFQSVRIRIRFPKIHIHINVHVPFIRHITRKFTGSVSGRLTSSIVNDLGVAIDIPLSGIRVQLKDKDKIADELFSETYTDEYGYYNMSYDKVQTLLEGTDVELYVYIKSKNEKYDIKTLKNSTLGPAYSEKFVMDPVGTDGGNRTKDMNTAFAAFRVTSWAVRCWEHAKNNDIKLVDGLSILPHYRNGSAFDEHGGKVVGIKPTIFLESTDCNQEYTMYHEFGHFLMWNVQGRTYINVISKTAKADHRWSEENTSRLAWSEGWADAHAMIMDAAHYWEDEEYGFRTITIKTPLFENRERGWQKNQGGEINNGLWSEYFIACAIYDLWDGAGKGVSTTVGGKTVGYIDELTGGWSTEDDVELGFSQIVQPLIDNSGLLKRLLHNIDEYYGALQSKVGDCISQNKISRAFSENRVVFNITDYELVKGYGVMTYGGGIAQSVTVHITGKTGIGTNSTYEDTYGLTYLMNVTDVTLDHKFFPFESDILYDYVTLGFDPGLKTNLNINTNSGVIDHVPILDPNYQSGTLSTCGQSGIEVQNGMVNVGGVGTGYTANLVVNDFGIVRTDSKGILNINQGSNLIVKNGGTLLIRSGSTLNVYGKIIVEAGGYICIESGANLNFSQSSELYIDQSAIININPIYNSITHVCNKVLNVCANLTGNNTQISVIPYISFPLSADINLRSGNSTVLRAGAAGLNFDGIDDYVSGNNPMTFPDQGAITFWMNPAVVENYRNPFSTTDFNGGIRFEESTTAPYGFIALFGNETGFGGFWQRHVYLDVNEMIPNKWYHVIITWDKTRAGGPVVSGYLNGTQKFFEEPQSISNFPNTFPKISIGTGFDASPNRHFQGMMDDVGIYNKYISTQTDILATMQGALSSNVLAYWDFSEGTGISTVNNAGGNPGTLQNGTSWVTSNTPIAYTWTPSSGLSPTFGALVVANPSASTTYTVTATASGYCTSTSTIQINVGPNYRLATQDQAQSSNVGIVGNNISAYPNPASGSLTVSVTGGSYKVEILDMQGRVLNQYNSIEETLNINVSDLHTGLYMFQIIQNGITSRKKLEIQN